MDLKTFRNTLKADDLGDERFELLSLLENHTTDSSLYVLFRSLQANYTFLEHCQAILESRLHKYIDSFYLKLRGSVTSHTALRATADLDIDLILPRLPGLSKESVDQMAERLQSSTGFSLEIALEDTFKQLLNHLYDIIAPTDDPNSPLYRPSGAVPPVTRSLPLRFKVDGREEQVDLFPKVIDSDGCVWTLGKELENGGRGWMRNETCVQPPLKLNDERECAILLLKLWKEHGKIVAEKTAKMQQKKDEVNNAEKAVRYAEHVLKKGVAPNTKAHTKNQSNFEVRRMQFVKAEDNLKGARESPDVKKWAMPKSFHLVRAMNTIPIATAPSNDAEVPQGQEKSFSRQKVLKYLDELLDCLLEEYKPEQRNREDSLLNNDFPVADFPEVTHQAALSNLKDLKDNLLSFLDETVEQESSAGIVG